MCVSVHNMTLTLLHNFACWGGGEDEGGFVVQTVILPGL